VIPANGSECFESADLGLDVVDFDVEVPSFLPGPRIDLLLVGGECCGPETDGEWGPAIAASVGQLIG